MIPKETTKIRLGEFEGWLLSESWICPGRALVPHDHCDESGRITNLEISYAHYFPDRDEVLRFTKKIGTGADIELL